MTTKTEAAFEVRKVLQAVKDYLAAPGYKLSEADTRAHFIDPLLRSLGYHAIGDIQHEVYVQDAKQFLDYQLIVDGLPRVAVEAKAVDVPMADVHGAQVVQYCSVLGVEWAVVTNMRHWRLYHSFTNGPLSDKLVLSISLVDWETDAQYEAVFEQVWLISKEAFLTTGGPNAWLAAQQLEVALKQALTDPASPEVIYLRKRLQEAGIAVSAEDVAAWLAAKVNATPTSPSPTAKAGTPVTPVAGPVSATPGIAPPTPPPGHQASHWLVPAARKQGLSAAQHLQLWLDAGYWGFWENTPGRKAVKAGDWVVFYASKVGTLHAYARVTADPTTLLADGEWPEPGVPSQPTYKVPLADITWIDPPRKLDEALRSQLDWYQGRSPTHKWESLVMTNRRISPGDFAKLTGKV